MPIYEDLGVALRLVFSDSPDDCEHRYHLNKQSHSMKAHQNHMSYCTQWARKEASETLFWGTEAKFWSFWHFSTNPHTLRMCGKLPNLPNIAWVSQNRVSRKIIFVLLFWIFLPGSTLKNFSLTLCPKIFSWLHHMYSDSQKKLGQKLKVKLFKIAPYVEVT